MSIVKSISRFCQYRCFSESLSTSVISDIRASLNQGNDLYGRKYSFSSTIIQNPCCEILVTSTSKMGFPAFFDFIFPVFYNLSQFIKFLITKSYGSRYLYLGIYPKFRFTRRTYNLYMLPCFFSREKEKSIILIPENCWAHEECPVYKTD
jgi:hypothetical protein